MKVSRSKTEYLCRNGGNDKKTVKMDDTKVPRIKEFKYLISTVKESGSCEREVNNRVQEKWNGWRKVLGVICDRRLPATVPVKKNFTLSKYRCKKTKQKYYAIYFIYYVKIFSHSIFYNLAFAINDHLKSFGHGIRKRSKIRGPQSYAKLFSSFCKSSMLLGRVS